MKHKERTIQQLWFTYNGLTLRADRLWRQSDRNTLTTRVRNAVSTEIMNRMDKANNAFWNGGAK